MVRKEKSASTPYPREIRTILGEGAHFDGVLSFEGSVRIDGQLKGEIISRGTLLVGEKSMIQAEIKVDSIIVGGKIRGNILASGRMEILASAEIYGNIRTPVLKIEEGAIFQGTCEMKKTDQDTKSLSYLNDQGAQVVAEHPVEMEEVAKG